MIFPSVILEATVLTVRQLLPQTQPCKAQCFTRPPGTFVTLSFKSSRNSHLETEISRKNQAKNQRELAHLFPVGPGLVVQVLAEPDSF